MKRKIIPYTLTILAFAAVFALLTFIMIKQSESADIQKKLLEESKAAITARIDKLEENTDSDTLVQIKECEMKAVQTVINIFSPQEVARDSTIEYDHNFFSDEAYEQFLSLRKSFAGQQLIEASANSSGYNTREETIQVFVPFYYSGYEGRTQFNFNFIKKDDKWIIEYISGDM